MRRTCIYKNINTTSTPITNNSTINNSKTLPYLIKVISKDGFVNIRKTPKWNNSDIVGQIPTSNIKYTIIEEIMLNIMFEVPSREDILKVRITEEAVTGSKDPIYYDLDGNEVNK